MNSQQEKLLKVNQLTTGFRTEEGFAPAVQDVSFEIGQGQTFALVGESGCGKSVTALSIMRLVPDPPGEIVSGKIELEGLDLLKLNENRMRKVRGNRISMVFQEPMTSLNPVFTVGNQIVEAVRMHQKVRRRAAWPQAEAALKEVGIPDPTQRVSEYPHQMSGGMRQRAMIAMAISCDPALLIADEPTTALDVTTQAQILDLLERLKQQRKMSILLITHDLGVVAERADEVAVMYASRISEKAPSDELFSEPLHPYTRGLLESLPRLGVGLKRLPTISGMVPELTDFPSGCKFHPRCRLGSNDPRCRRIEPELRKVAPRRQVACWYAPGYETDQERKQYEQKYGKKQRASSS